tara:strand:+ start:389 stop:1576 length:1188 start_codon:yes stop_codon:yes gene_type:complete
MKKIISILGSTGSIGLNTLKIISKKKKLFKVNILAANKNYRLICNQIKLYKPKVFVINDCEVLNKVKKKFKKNKVKIVSEIDLKNKFFKKSDISIAAIPGIAGLKPTIDLTQISKKILIANKESIICGWNLIQKSAFKNKTKIIPIDSEHFSIMELLKNHKIKDINKIYLTASGGPFLNYKLLNLNKVKPKDAIKHPKWKMGKKISIDSATLMNKMFETIEAQKLFSINLKKIEIVIHPESLIHAIIELKNGLFKFIYHETTMMIPIANAMLDKNLNINNLLRRKSNKKKGIFFENLNFKNVDIKRFPVIKLKPRINEYYSTPIILNAVNEILVDQFLKKKIPFTSFYNYIMSVLNDRNYKKNAIKIPRNISQVFEIDQWSRNLVYKKIYSKNYV